MNCQKCIYNIMNNSGLISPENTSKNYSRMLTCSKFILIFRNDIKTNFKVLDRYNKASQSYYLPPTSPTTTTRTYYGVQELDSDGHPQQGHNPVSHVT